MSKPKSKKTKILQVAVSAFVAYTVISFFVMQVDISNRRENLDALEKELSQQQYLNKEMQTIIESGTDTDYLIKAAREKLGYVFPDERVFIDPNRKQ